MQSAENRTASTTKLRGNRLTGYAAKFNDPTNISGEFIEIIRPGAFANSLKRRDVLALLHHLDSRILGRMSSGTLNLREDRFGLKFELEVDPSTPDGATALGLVRRGDLTGMSFGFAAIAEDWEPGHYPDLPVRTLTEVSLREVSIVAFPAYNGTSVALASTDLAGLRAKVERDLKVRGIG